MRRQFALFLLLATLACAGDRQPLAPPAAADGRAGRDLAGQLMLKRFIVEVEPGVDPAEVAREHSLQPRYIYSSVLTGFAGAMSDAARNGLLRDGRVRRVQPEQVNYGDDVTTTASSWGLDRVDQRTSTLDGYYTYDATGKGVTVYILDTGIRFSHSDFGGRASSGFDAWGGDGSDCQGHGTHVAGTVGGTIYGVAKGVHLVSVRVLDCSSTGSTTTVLAGLDWVLANAQRPAVVNMSLGGDPDDLVDAAVRRLTDAGIAVVVSAGNNNSDACLRSPARVTQAITVGASTMSDERANFSNYGDCVDWYAPGWIIVSDSYRSDDGTTSMSGTSMAAPHTTGAAALFLERNPSAGAADVVAALAARATARVVSTGIKGGKADLLYTRADVPTGNASPIAGFDVSCTSLSCDFTDRSTDVDGTISAWLWKFGDGSTTNLQSPTHTYGAAGSFDVALTVTDNAGATATTVKQVTVGSVGPTNTPPTAAFSATCSRLSCSFSDQSMDPDGSVVQWTWNFGDGSSMLSAAAIGQAHTFTAGGTYTVDLTVTDNGGATATSTQAVEAGIILVAAGYREKGRHVFDLTWKGAETTRVDIYLGTLLLTTVDATAGSYSFGTQTHGQGSYDFRVCEEGTTYCSETMTVIF